MKRSARTSAENVRRVHELRGEAMTIKRISVTFGIAESTLLARLRALWRLSGWRAVPEGRPFPTAS